MKNRKGNTKKNKSSNFSKLSIFQPNKYKFKKSCPLSSKGAPIVDYKNIKLLKRYVSEMAKFCHQELQIFLKKNKESSLYLSKEQEIWH